MKKITLLFLLSSTLLFSSDASQEDLNAIYQEALLFVAVFGVMGIISFIYSSKHAKAYIPKGLTAEELEIKAFNESRVQELSKLLDEKRVTKEEFNILNQHYKSR